MSDLYDGDAVLMDPKRLDQHILEEHKEFARSKPAALMLKQWLSSNGSGGQLPTLPGLYRLLVEWGQFKLGAIEEDDGVNLDPFV